MQDSTHQEEHRCACGSTDLRYEDGEEGTEGAVDAEDEGRVREVEDRDRDEPASHCEEVSKALKIRLLNSLKAIWH